MLLIRRVRLDPDQVSADPRSRRRRTLHPDQRDMLFPELADEPIYAYSFICTNIDCLDPGESRHGRVLVPASHHGGDEQAAMLS